MKYAAIIMALLILSVVIAGCGSKETETTTTTKTTNTATTENTQQIDEVTGELIDENEEVNVGDVI